MQANKKKYCFSVILVWAVFFCLDSRMVSFAIYTPNGCEVTWVRPSQEYTEAEFQIAVAFQDSMVAADGLTGEVMLEPVSNEYNCFGYCWHMAGTENSPIWIDYDYEYWDPDYFNETTECEASYEEVGSGEEGSKIRYEIWHGGVVQADGCVISKWGNLGLFLHEEDKVPTIYGACLSYYNPADDAGACSVDDFVVEDGNANWTIWDEDGAPESFHVFSSLNFDLGPWVEIGEVEYTGLGSYRMAIESGNKGMLYRLKEKDSRGKLEVIATFIPREERVPSSPPKMESPKKLREILELQMKDLEASIRAAGTQKAGDLPTECVIYVAPQFVSDVQAYLEFFWEECMGVGIELVDVSIFPSQSDDFREALKASIAGKATEGVELFHLIGDASEWEEVALMDPVYFPFNGVVQPGRDLIPTFYLYDSPTLSYHRPYYSSDFPYSDLDDDGFPDVVVTRWPIATSEELLPRISKIIEYNQGRGTTSSFSNMDFLGLIADRDWDGNSGALAEEIAVNAINNIPVDEGVTISVQRVSESGIEPNGNAYGPWAVGLLNEVQPECLFMWSPHSNRYFANLFLDYNDDGLDETYPSLIVASNCLTADFSRTDSFYNEGVYSKTAAADIYGQFYDRGCIAWVGPTAKSFQRVNGALTKAYAHNLFVNPEWTMAKAWLESVREALILAENDPIMEKNIRAYAFLGDPISRLEKKQTSTLFADVSAPSISGFLSAYNSADWADYDGDGDEDLYLCNAFHDGNSQTVSPNKLIRNDGGGSFVDVTLDNDIWIDSDAPSISSAWGDVDNDGDPDLYVSNGDTNDPNCANLLFLNSGSGFSEPFRGTGELDLNDSNMGGRAEWIDLDLDGDLDLYVGRPGNTSLVFETIDDNGSLGFELRDVDLLTTLVTKGYSSWGDFDGDGKVDVFVSSYQGGKLLKSNGDWSFSDATFSTFQEDEQNLDGAGMAVAWGDYDNDGDFDLFVGHNSQEFYSRLFRNDEGTHFTEVTSEVGLPTSEWWATDSVAWSDLDKDGDLDLIVGDEETCVWENLFPLPKFKKLMRCDFSSQSDQSDLLTISLSDFDMDGDEDLYIGVNHSSQQSPDQSHLFQNNTSNSSNWIKVCLAGSVTNRDGIGAIVEVVSSDDLIQTRQLVGMVGGNSHASRMQTIGLGSKSQAKKIRVEWPWGRVTEVPLVQSGSTTTITDENAASQGGSIYLTVNPSGIRQEPSSPLEHEDIFDLYLAADVSSCMESGYLLGGFETQVNFPTNLYIFQEELLVQGVDEDPDQYSYSMKFSQGVVGDQGPIPLVRFRAFVVKEGADPVISLGNVTNPSFQDPIEPTVQCWWEWNSDVLFRFTTPTLEDCGLSYILDDRKAPLLSHSGLWQDNRAVVIVSYDEPMNDTAIDPSHYRVYSVENPSVEIDIEEAVFNNSSSRKDIALLLSSEIPALKNYDIEITGVEDLHGNVSGTLVGPVTRDDPNPPHVKISEILIPPPPGKENSTGNLQWIELENDGEFSYCMNGWSIVSGQDNKIEVPEFPIVILPAGGLVVFDSSGQLVDLTDPRLNIVAMGDLLPITGSQISVEDPFGVETDAVGSSVVAKSTSAGKCSMQRFVSPGDYSVSWVEDAPEYIDGYRGTPAEENVLADGQPMYEEIPIIGDSRLLYAAPNPFNPETKIYMALAEGGQVNVSVYDVRGRKVRTLLDEVRQPTAMLELTWNGVSDRGERVSSGVYFVKMKAPGGVSDVLKVSLVK